MSVPIWDQNHPHFRQACDDAENYLRRDYNFLEYKNVFDLLGDELIESIYIPEINCFLDDYLTDSGKTHAEVRKEYIDDYGTEPEDDDIVEFLSDELEQFRDDSPNYPSHDTLYEARNSYDSDWIMNNAHKLFALGIGVINQTERFNAMLFIDGGGYDFHEEHWVPMYCMRGWITENKY